MISIAKLARLLRTPQGLGQASQQPRIRLGSDDQTCSESGFTILELMVAMAILLIMSAAVLSLLLSAMRLQSRARARTIAAQVAERTLEEARSAGVYSLQQIILYYGGQYQFAPLTEGPFTFYRRIDVSWEAVSGTANPSGADIIRVTAEVTWNNMGSDAPVSMTTYVGGPPCPTNSGYVKVRVVDHLFDPLPNVRLDMRTNTGLSWGTGFTASDGSFIFTCVFANSYEITGTLTGYIAKDRSSKVIVPNIAVVPRQVTTVEFQMARPATLEVRLHDAVSDRELTGSAAASVSKADFGPLVLTGRSPFTFQNLWPDTYSIVGAVFDCSGGGGYMSSVVGSVDLLLQPGTNSTTLKLSPGPQVTVEVTVLGDNAAPVQNASVVARDACGFVNTFPVTNSSGVSQRSGIRPGPYELTVTPPPASGYRTSTSRFIASSDPTRVTVFVSR